MHAEENKRRTIQKSDIANAVAKSDLYDFLIDIIPRNSDAAPGEKRGGGGNGGGVVVPPVVKNTNEEVVSEMGASDMYENPVCLRLFSLRLMSFF